MDWAFVPPLGLLAAFMTGAIALNLTPGADMTYVIARSLAQGPRAGVASAFGIMGGSLIHTLLAALGVTALLAASLLAFDVLKYAGAGYLLFLAWQILRAPLVPQPGKIKPMSAWRVFSQGVVINVLNPKILVFMMAFLPQFVAIEQGAVTWQIIFLGTLFNISGTAINSVVALTAGHGARRLAGQPRVALTLKWLAASIMGGLALRLFFLRAS